MEDDLISRALQGDTVAFQAIVKRYSEVAWRVARVLLPDCQAAEDALQEAWLDVWRGLPGYSTTRPFRPWLLAVYSQPLSHDLSAALARNGATAARACGDPSGNYECRGGRASART